LSVATDQAMSNIAPITSANPSVAEMEARVARFKDLKPTDDYVDSAIPGCERTTLRVLGESPQAPLAAEGFHMSIVHCEVCKSAPLHNHLTQKIFLVGASALDTGMRVSGRFSAAVADHALIGNRYQV
jgi:hypothetical protein